ncbi:hypothetical protein Aple_002910 [Acrocarpospora pleiomorpha]|uniref:Endonuclease/exonuclease/phosphatase domain-containing protein n=1 Tax=Acrocarpospora pleiomorpha TaxID=90975 RepID=A0A5M3X9R3_9ACTN|nr:hypothetical protein [Acrocarpospora pleiomorpha]GES17396.1 hypothetical protein Aple_002910 [Acrocarpospora pleiomorpha]
MKALRAALTALTLTAVTGLSAAPAHADPEPTIQADAAYSTTACDPRGVTSSDNSLAATLNGKLTKKMRGAMTGYRVSCARMVVNTVRNLGLHSRAAVIAITTVIVESAIQNIDQEYDHDSLGLFQQRGTWGSRAQRLDPVWATTAFINKMKRVYPNNAWMTTPIGEVCQGVQVSAYPAKYPPEVSDAQIIVNHLWQPAPTPTHGRDSTGYYNPADGTFHLRNVLGDGTSNYAWGTSLETLPNALVLTGDWNGDGKDSMGYYNPADGTFHLRNTLDDGGSNTAWDTSLETLPDAVVLTGDWNGDGKDSFGYYNPADGTFHLRNAHNDGSSDYAWGTALETVPDAVVLVGDWNGDGKDSLGYYNPADGTFHLRNALNDGSSDYAWGTSLETLPDAVVLTGDWNGDGKDSLGYYNPADGTYHLRDTLDDGGSDYAWGTALETVPGAVILTGDWNGS